MPARRIDLRRLRGKGLNKPGVKRYLQDAVKDYLIKRLMMERLLPRLRARDTAIKYVRSRTMLQLKKLVDTKCRKLDLAQFLNRNSNQNASRSKNEEMKHPEDHSETSMDDKKKAIYGGAIFKTGINLFSKGQLNNQKNVMQQNGPSSSQFGNLGNLGNLKCSIQKRRGNPAPISTHRSQATIWSKMMEADLIAMGKEKAKEEVHQRRRRTRFTRELQKQVALKEKRREAKRLQKKADLERIRRREAEYQLNQEAEKLRKLEDMRLHQREMAAVVQRKRDKRERKMQQDGEEQRAMLQRLAAEQARAREEVSREARKQQAAMAKVKVECQRQIQRKAALKAKEQAADMKLAEEWTKMVTAREQKRKSEVRERKVRIEGKLKAMEGHYENLASKQTKREAAVSDAVQRRYREMDRKAKKKAEKQRQMQQACNRQVAHMLEAKDQQRKQALENKRKDNERMRAEGAAFEKEKEEKIRRSRLQQQRQRKVLEDQIRCKSQIPRDISETRHVLLMNKSLLHKIKTDVDVSDILQRIPQKQKGLQLRPLRRKRR